MLQANPRRRPHTWRPASPRRRRRPQLTIVLGFSMATYPPTGVLQRWSLDHRADHYDPVDDHEEWMIATKIINSTPR